MGTLVTNKAKLILASFVAPLVALLPLTILAIYILLEPAIDNLGQPDNAPRRATGTLLYFVMPLLYLVLVILMSSLGYILSTIKKLSLVNSMAIAVMISLLIGIFFSRESPFGYKDQIISFVVFFRVACSAHYLVYIAGGV